VNRSTSVIVGGGLAGAKAAATLREEGFDGRVVLVGEEPYPPYERPPLSKQLLRGESEVRDTFVHPDDFYATNDVELRIGRRAENLDARSQTLTVDGEAIRYDELLLATGARPRRLTVPGATLVGVHSLRNLDDNAALRSALSMPSRVAVVGAGWIGSEVAASLRQLGHDVALIDPSPAPLVHVLGPEIGAVFRDLHARHGVELHLGASVEQFLGQAHVTGVRTSDGVEVEADVVVVGVGVEPNVELARNAGLTIENGIVVDEFLRTGAPNVFAAGDVAAAWHPFYARRIRVEHWANAAHQGVAAARNMVGPPTPYDRLPYFFSDQYELGMEYTGYARQWDRVVLRGDPASFEFIAFWISEDRVVAAMNVNVWDVVEPLRAVIASRAQVDDRLLTDPDVPLDALVARAETARG
jgi:3-phenylpropionate/trans-cinnamate dioxygenase ferredoxin reductase subunit